ncbi:NAD(P)H-dependent oxidoreductase [Desulfocurvus sp. DL9XJH121]
MRMLVILGHPRPGSLNHALAGRGVETLEELGHEVVFHDLCAEGFDPALPGDEAGRGAVLPPDVARHCEELRDAEGVVVVHPNWWGMPPAVLKGWIDRVVRVDVAYRFVGEDGGEGVPQGLLKARRALVLNTTDTDPAREAAVFGDPLERIWKDCVFGLCGVTDVTRLNFGTVCISTPEQRAAWLDQAEAQVRELFPA